MAKKSKSKSQVSPKMITSDAIQAMADNQIQQRFAQVGEKPSAISKLGNIVAKGAEFINSPLGKLATNALSFIPGVGPAISGGVKMLANVVSGNDDEWFEGFTAAGATFNEPLGVYSYKTTDSDVTFKNVNGCVARIPTSLPTSNYWQQQLLPTILAYVRSKTNNVLNATEADYWRAFMDAMQLYAGYYQGLKYIKLMSEVPTNISNISSLYPCVQPINLSQFKGMIDELGDYLRATVRLPYALTAYIRWRFGTTFLSSNTGRPGLIHYDYSGIGNMANVTISTYNNFIQGLKTQLTTYARAISDITLAYKDHSVKYDVESRMFDNKEFCLRANLQPVKTGLYDISDYNAPVGNFVYLDSRLDQNAAFQAVTLSTGTADTSVDAPFGVVNTVYIDLYIVGGGYAVYEDTDGTTGRHSMTPGWWTTILSPAKTNKSGTFKFKMTNAGGGNTKIAVTITPNYSFTGAVKANIADEIMAYYLSSLAFDSLEFHNYYSGQYNIDDGDSSDYYAYRTTSLSFDTAYVADEHIKSTNVLAMRNLIRGDYAKATPPNTRPETTEAVKDLAEAVEEII